MNRIKNKKNSKKDKAIKTEEINRLNNNENFEVENTTNNKNFEAENNINSKDFEVENNINNENFEVENNVNIYEKDIAKKDIEVATDDKKSKRKIKSRRIIAIVSLVVVTVILGIFAYFIIKKFDLINGDIHKFKQLLESYGWKGKFVALGLQCLQVIIAIIPGELVEIGTGYVYGAVEGTLICLIGVTIGSVIIFILTKKFGVKLVELFFDIDKLNSFKFINSEKKLKRLVFILYFIPGTPKDMLTYFAGLTRLKLSEFILITMIARIPSILSSTIGGQYIGEKDYT
ncbi:MAG: VTT domain-containing protein, partial [Clostridia bacterium]